MMEKREDPQIQLVAIDLDGTLLRSDKTISTVNRASISEAVRSHIHVVLATGRPFSHVKPYIEQLNLKTYLVTANGAEIYDRDHRCIARHAMEPNQILSLAAVAGKADSEYWVLSEDELYQNELPDHVHDITWLKFGYKPGTEEGANRIREMIQSFDGLEVTNTIPSNLEVNAKGVHKASGIKLVCEKLHVPMEQVMAIGDALNDLELIQQAGFGVAMGNAQEIVKMKADAVTASNDEDGVAKALSAYLFGGNVLI